MSTTHNCNRIAVTWSQEHTVSENDRVRRGSNSGRRDESISSISPAPLIFAPHIKPSGCFSTMLRFFFNYYVPLRSVLLYTFASTHSVKLSLRYQAQLRSSSITPSSSFATMLHYHAPSYRVPLKCKNNTNLSIRYHVPLRSTLHHTALLYIQRRVVA